MDKVQEFFKKIADAAWFQTSITVVILLAGVLVGIETYPALVERFEHPIHIGDQIILWIFVAEIVVKMLAEGKKPWRYFLDPWNVFDFVIVAACFLPFEGNAVTVLRLLRLLRVLKLVKALPKLQILVGALLKSIPSMVYVSLLLFMLFYVYAVAAVFLFGTNDPLHFENLEIAMLSLFRVVTLEDWTDVMYINMYGCDRYGYSADSVVQCVTPKAQPLLGALFFVSFVLTGTMIILNLFIGVIMSGMDEAQAEAADMARMEQADKKPTVVSEVDILVEQVAALSERLAALQRMAKNQQQDE
ncbi:K+ transporter, Kef-type [Plesiocystis pacifica SIR-1]|uniref:K+ transporter, Kef-type n=1 Tax=Plesiocystis pacifica SIR-1 TaxID=391625 RepID=A6GA84_9BACT|nr:ion transporter [Plesiocystis pacifica]EDM77186.1 K+ transporter, Kef-type [Plesiocystis pacifica SIR-1]